MKATIHKVIGYKTFPLYKIEITDKKDDSIVSKTKFDPPSTMSFPIFKDENFEVECGEGNINI